MTGLRVDHPDGLRDPAGYLRAAAAGRTGRRWTRGREDPRAGEELPRLAGRRHHRLRRAAPRSAASSSTRPARRAFTALDDRAHRRPDVLAGAGRTTASCDVATALLAAELRRLGRLAPEVAGRRGGARRAARPASRSTAPTCRTAPTTSTRRGRGRAARRPDLAVGVRRARRPAAPTPTTSWPCGSSSSPARSWPRASRTPRSTGGPGSSRSTRSAATRPGSAVPLAEFHAAAARPAGPAAGRDDHAVHPRHQAQRGRPGPARRAVRDAGRVGRGGAPLVRARRRCPTGALGAPALADGRRRLADRRGSGCTRTSRRRPGRRAHATSWNDPDPAFEAALHAVVDPRLDDPAAARRRGRFAAPDRPARLVERARPEAGAAHHAGRAGHLPGHRAVGPLAGRPRQPAAGRLRRRARELLARLDDGLAAAGRRRTARRSCWSSPGAAAAPGPAGAVHRRTGRSRRPGRPPTTWSPSTAAAR